MERFSKSLMAGVFIAGAAVGAAAALLYAPKSGAQTRKDLRKFSKRTVDKIDDLQNDVRGQITDWVEDVSGVIEDGKSRLKKMIQTA